MLKFGLNDSELVGDWNLDDYRLVNGNSWIEIYEHRLLESFVYFGQNGLKILVRELERAVKVPLVTKVIYERLEFENHAVRSSEGDLDWILLATEAGKIVVESGPGGIAPLYILNSNKSVSGSWDPFDHYKSLDDQPLNLNRSIHYLCNFSQPYSKETIFSGLTRVTNGSKVIVNKREGKSNVDYLYPKEESLPRPRILKKGADPVDSFVRIIQDYYSHRFGSDSIHTHLSGGFDSGLVAATAAAKFSNLVYSYSLIQLGQQGVYQRMRCGEFESKFGLVNTEMNMGEYPIFCSGFSRVDSNRAVPWEDCYSEAFENILRVISSRGGITLLMGTGGDELTYPHWHELDSKKKELQKRLVYPRKETLPKFLTKDAIDLFYQTFSKIDRAPTMKVSSSALDDQCITAPQCLRYGIWPIHPLTSRQMVIFCRSLPSSWRLKRRIFKEALSRLGCSNQIIKPIKKDSFSGIMIESLSQKSREKILNLFADSRLAKLNLLSREKLLSEFELFIKNPDISNVGHFYAVANLEFTLNSIHELKENN